MHIKKYNMHYRLEQAYKKRIDMIFYENIWLHHGWKNKLMFSKIRFLWLQNIIVFQGYKNHDPLNLTLKKDKEFGKNYM